MSTDVDIHVDNPVTRKVKRISFKHVMSFLFLLAFFSYSFYQVSQKPRILVLHSYDTDYDWVNEVSEGIRSVLDNKRYLVRWHYMKTKKNPGNEFGRKAGVRALDLIAEWEPNVIIAIDDNAQKYVAKHYIDEIKRPAYKTNIVYSGVGAEPEAYGYDRAKNVTGILERMPLDAIKYSALQVFSEPARIRKIRLLHISDSSKSGCLNKQQIDQFKWWPEILKESHDVSSFENWKKVLSERGEFADILLMTNYDTLTPGTLESQSKLDCHDVSSDRNKDKNQKPNSIELQTNIDKKIKQDFVPREKVVTWSKSEFPSLIMGGWGFFVKNGGHLAVAISGFEQGEVAAQMAVKIIGTVANTAKNTKKINRAQAPWEIDGRSTEQFIIHYNGSYDFYQHPNYPMIPAFYESFARAAGTYRENEK